MEEGGTRTRTPFSPVPLIAAAVATLAGCGPADVAPVQPGPVGEPAAGSHWFTEVAAEAGLDFVHTTGATGAYSFPEIAASGCGLFDYDGDGDLDVYAVQAHRLDVAGPGGANRLYRNDLSAGPDGVPRLRFVDVTEPSGLGDRGYGMGAAVCDYDNDGDLDLYATNFGPNALYRNDGDAGFTDVSATAIPPEDRWSTSAAFVDYDRDGDADLVVVNYVNFSVREDKICHSDSGRRDYCGPSSFDPVSDRLFRNNGDGTFSDATTEAGLDLAWGSGLGVVCADFNGDAWPDMYVANDGNANQLWINRRDGTFGDEALIAGAAYNADGRPEAGMGVTAADFDLDGDQDIFLSHLLGEHNTLLVNDGRGFFEDRSDSFGVSSPSVPRTGFGARWADFDGDGLLDLLVANGGVKIVEEEALDPYPYGNPNLLMRNLGPPDFTFAPVADPSIERIETSRGAAFGDIDNDGDIDVLISTSNGPLRLLRNDVGSSRPWLSLRLAGARSNRSAIGATVTLLRPGRPSLIRRVHADGSYCSFSDLRVHLALETEAPATVEVEWPGGLRETFAGLSPRRHHLLLEGTGAAPP